ncbi:hypothetical protein Tco_1253449 [Tanacetum coccineum]
MGDENPIRTLRDYSKPSHEGYMNTIELLEGNNVVPFRSDTIRLLQNECSFHGLRSKDPNQHLKDFLKLVDSLDIDKQHDDLLAKLHESVFKAATYKRGLVTVEAQLVTYRKNEVLFSEEVVVLKREVGCKQYEINMLKTEFEKVRQEKDGIEFKIKKFDKASKDLDQLLESQITDKICGLRANKSVWENSSNETKKNSDAPLIEEWVSDNEDEVESPVVVKKKTVFPNAAKIEFVRRKQHKKPVRKPVKYAEMYSFDHLKKDCGKRIIKPVWKNTKRVNDHYSTRMTHSNSRRNMIPQAVLMRSGIKAVNTAKPKDAHNAVKRNRFNTVKASACWVWMPKNRVIDHDPSKHGRNNAQIDKDHFGLDGCINSGEAGVQQRKRRIQRRVQQKQKDQEDEVFGRILSAKKMKTVEGLKIAGYKVTTAGLRLLLLILKSRFRILFDIHTRFLLLLFWIYPRRNYQEEPFTHKEEMAFSDSEVHNDKPCTKSCLKNYETLKKQYDDLLAKLHESEFKAATYKRGLATVEAQVVTYRKNEVLFSEEVDVLKREVGIKQYEINVLKSELEKVKQEKDGIEFKIEKFDKASKDLDYLEEFQQPEFEVYGLRANKSVCENSSNETNKNADAPLIEEWVFDNEDEVESPVVAEKKTVVPTIPKVNVVRPKQQEKSVRKTVRYAEMYRSKGPRGNQRNWNNLKSQQLGNDFVMHNKACYVCGSFDHLQYTCKQKRQLNGQREEKPVWNNARRVNHQNSPRITQPNPKRHMVQRKILTRSGPISLNTARQSYLNAVCCCCSRQVNTARPKAVVNAWS